MEKLYRNERNGKNSPGERFLEDVKAFLFVMRLNYLFTGWCQG